MRKLSTAAARLVAAIGNLENAVAAAILPLSLPDPALSTAVPVLSAKK